jgi:hypothetical protein
MRVKDELIKDFGQKTAPANSFPSAARSDDGNIGTEIAEGNVPALAKTAGSAVGGVAGGALGALAGPEGMAAGAIAGSMAGEGAGEMVGEVEGSAKGDDSEYTQPACNLPQQVSQREILRQNEQRGDNSWTAGDTRPQYQGFSESKKEESPGKRYAEGPIEKTLVQPGHKERKGERMVPPSPGDPHNPHQVHSSSPNQVKRDIKREQREER